MKIFSAIFKTKKARQIRSISEYQQDMLSKLGREQFKKLEKMGLTVPVALL